MIRSLKGLNPSIHNESYIDESAQIIGDVRIQKDVTVWPNAVLRADDRNFIEIGEGSNVQDGCIFHVAPENPLIIGKNVTIGHGVILHACRIEDEARVGMGATILDGAIVEKGAQVGANALVPAGKVIPSGTLAIGVPARIVRDLTLDEKEDIKNNAKAYVTLWKEYYSK